MAIKINNTEVIDNNRNVVNVGTINASGEIIASSLDISGDIDVDGTTNLDVVDIDGAVSFASTTAHADHATFVDNARAVFGNGSDLQIYHNGTDSFIDEQGSGWLYIRGNNTVIGKYTGETYMKGIADGAVELYYDNSKKFETTASGIAVTGNVTVSGTVDGRDIATNIPASLGTAGQVLTVNAGASAGEWADAAGGGGADLFAENYDGTSTLPSATGTNSVAIGAEAVAAIEQMSIAIGKSYSSGLESIALGIGNNTSSYGATGNRSFSVGYLSDAGGANGVSIGAFSKCAASSIAIGYGAHTAAGNSNVFGSYGYTSGQRSLVLSNASATQGTKATQTYAVAIGNNSLSDVRGKYAFSNGSFSAVGDSQTGTLVMRCDTTDATPEVITTENSTPSYRNQVNLPDNSAYTFSGTIVARQQAATGTDVGAWEVKGIIRREANAGTTVLVNSVLNEINAPTGWAVALTADTTNGGLKIEVTGVASTNIRWVATIQTAEVTYA